MRVILPIGPDPEDAARDAAELLARGPQAQALLASTADQGREGDPSRLAFGSWALETGTALCDAGRRADGIALLEAAAQILEVVVGHHPHEPDTLRTAARSIAALSEALMLENRPAEAWEWAARSLAVPARLADAEPGDPEGALLSSRLHATLAGLSLARRPPPPCSMADTRQAGDPLVPVEAFHAYLAEAVDHARTAVRRAPDDLPCLHQLAQEAWNLALYLEHRPGLPGDDHRHYARLVLDASRGVGNREPYVTSLAPARAWAETRAR